MTSKIFLKFNFNNKSVVEELGSYFSYTIKNLSIDDFKRNMILDAGFSNFFIVKGRHNKKMIELLQGKIGAILKSQSEVSLVILEKGDIFYEIMVSENHRRLDKLIIRKIMSKSGKTLPLINECMLENN